MEKPFNPAIPDDGTTTLPYVITQDSWYRGARNFALVPLLASAVFLLAGVLTKSPAWLSLGPVLAGICFLPSVLCLLRYVSMARSDPEGGPTTFLKRLVLLLVLIGLNFGLGTGAMFFAIYLA